MNCIISNHPYYIQGLLYSYRKSFFNQFCNIIIYILSFFTQMFTQFLDSQP